MNARTPRLRAFARPWPALGRMLVAGTALAACVVVPNAARAAATIDKFSLILSANPARITPTGFNDSVIQQLNRTVIAPKGLESIGTFRFAMLFDADAHYFVRPNFAVDAGVGQLRSIIKQEYLPMLNAAIQYRAEILSIPVHAGATYYLPGYNQGDFAARPYVGAGMLSLVYNRARFQAVENGTDSTSTLGGTYKISAKRDAPGYYGEIGFQMFFASRFSVVIGALYRSAKIRDMVAIKQRPTPAGIVTTRQPSFILDTSSIGGRFGVAIGL